MSGIVQKASATANATSASATFGASVTKGNLIIVAIGTELGTTPESVSDGAQNYTQAAGQEGPSDEVSCWIYYATARSGTALTITAQMPGTDNINIHIYEVAGYSAVDVSGVSDGSSVSSPLAMNVATAQSTSYANDFVFVAAMVAGFGSANPSLTLGGNLVGESSTINGMAMGSGGEVASAEGVQIGTITATFAQGEAVYVIAVVTFAPTADPPSGGGTDGQQVTILESGYGYPAGSTPTLSYQVAQRLIALGVASLIGPPQSDGQTVQIIAGKDYVIGSTPTLSYQVAQRLIAKGFAVAI